MKDKVCKADHKTEINCSETCGFASNKTSHNSRTLHRFIEKHEQNVKMFVKSGKLDTFTFVGEHNASLLRRPLLLLISKLDPFALFFLQKIFILWVFLFYVLVLCCSCCSKQPGDYVRGHCRNGQGCLTEISREVRGQAFVHKNIHKRSLPFFQDMAD